MKKFIKYVLGSLLIIILSGTAYLHFVDVDFDAKICSGGYQRWVADKHTEALIQLFLAEQGYNKDVKYKLISKPEDVAATVEWERRTIRAILKIEVDNNKYDVSFNGKRYWIEKYNWKVASIES